MNKKTKLKIAIVSAIILLLGIFGWLGMHQNKTSHESVVFSHLANFLSVESMQFKGSLRTNQYNADFSTVVVGNASQTEAAIRPYSNSESVIKADVISTQEKNFLRITDARGLLNSLPGDPSSRAVKSNLARVSEEYTNKWIEIENDLSVPPDCIALLSGRGLLLSGKESLFSKYPFFEVKNVRDTSGLMVYDLAFNENLPLFLAAADADLKPKIDRCDYKNVRVSVTISKQSHQVTDIAFIGENIELKIFNITYKQAMTIKVPEAKRTLKDVKRTLGNLFIL